jgi:hypothetical protein
MPDALADILVTGAVVSAGHHLISGSATIEAALQAAGGLAYRPQMWPAGMITVRRPLGNRKVDLSIQLGRSRAASLAAVRNEIRRWDHHPMACGKRATVVELGWALIFATLCVAWE